MADDYDIVYVKSFRHPKTGKVLIAANFGLQAFPLKIRRTKKMKQNR